ncbi:MAG TPA: type II toxin-antitoxin system antitoxin SocA domain-containing protein [Sphingobium sp.]
MAKTPIDPKIAAELRHLALLPDDEIDTSDAPEVSDWSMAVRGRFSKSTLAERAYDVRAIANWILNYLEETSLSASNMSLNKLVYFVYERGIVELRTLFTPARAEAWDHGPVFREIYHAVKGENDQPISSRITKYSVRDREIVEAAEQFSAEDLDFFKSVIDDYKDFTAAQLRKISHRSGAPWDRVWKSATPVNPGMVISTDLILTFAPERRDLNGRS